jgi:predicted Zn-dependent protease
VAVKIAEEDTSADFSREPKPEVRIEPPVAAERRAVDLTRWEKKVKRYSAPFLRNPAIFVGQASFTFASVRKTMVTSEGTRLANNLSYARVFVNGTIKSDDGMELPLYSSYFAFAPEDLPGDRTIRGDAEVLADRLVKMRASDVAAPYTGPALLSGPAAAVFFHEILGHRVEGHRQKNEDEGQTFKQKLGESILPPELGVTFDPTRDKLGDRELAGFYRYDDEGVAARAVPVVVDGVLETFLMSRRPIDVLPTSNGHGRAQDGFAPVSRQSNMIVSTSKPVSEASLRQRLIALAKAQGKPFGLLFEDIQGGFTFTGRKMPNAFNLLPTEVYRVYVDGRPDELIRGVDLVGTPLVMFSMIEAAGDRYEVFNGMCGAESGSVPVAAAAPAMLVKQVEVQRKAKSQELPPLLPRPDAEPGKKGVRR